MKGKKVISLALATALAGLAACALTGCEWFSFDRTKKAKNVANTLGYPAYSGAWLASTEDNSHSDYYLQYQSAIANGEIDAGTTYLDFLKAMHDDSASLTSSLRASVAIATVFASGYSSLGSGVIYSLETNEEATTAYVVTNYHVVYSFTESAGNKFGKNFYTYLYGDSYSKDRVNSPDALRATYIGGVADQDIAVLSLEIPSDRVSFVQSIGESVGARNSDHITAGEKIYAIGNSLGYGISVVSGVIAVEAETLAMPKINAADGSVNMLETRIDAAVHHGNSGGGVFDSNGKLVAIVNGGQEEEVESTQIAVAGFGFAIPANRALSVAQSIIDNYKESGAGASATYGVLGTVSTAGSRGEYNSTTESIDIVETVKIASVSSRSPFGQDIVGKTLKKVIVKSGEGKTTISQNILRAHQVETLLYNLRLGDSVEFYFEDGSSAQATYSEKSYFAQA